MTRRKRKTAETRNGPLRIPLPADEALRLAMQVPPEKARKERKKKPKKGQ